jgi:hypothetical protein
MDNKEVQTSTGEPSMDAEYGEMFIAPSDGLRRELRPRHLYVIMIKNTVTCS